MLLNILGWECSPLGHRESIPGPISRQFREWMRSSVKKVTEIEWENGTHENTGGWYSNHRQGSWLIAEQLVFINGSLREVDYSTLAKNAGIAGTFGASSTWDTS